MMYHLNQLPEFIDEQNLALLVTMTIILVGLTFAITAHLLFKMQNEIKMLRADVQVETEQISAIKDEVIPVQPTETVEYTQAPPPPPMDQVIPETEAVEPPPPQQ